jgi:hypothetical protein
LKKLQGLVGSQNRWNKKILSNYQSEMRKIYEKAESLKQELFKGFMSDPPFYSKIISQSPQMQQDLMNFLDNPKQLLCLYRGSEHRFKA